MAGTFPRGFIWGTATAAHQVEGSNVASDLWAMRAITITATNRISPC